MVLYVNIYIVLLTYIILIFFFLTEAWWCFQCLLIDTSASPCCQIPLAEGALSRVQPGLGSRELLPLFLVFILTKLDSSLQST